MSKAIQIIRPLSPKLFRVSMFFTLMLISTPILKLDLILKLECNDLNYLNLVIKKRKWFLTLPFLVFPNRMVSKPPLTRTHSRNRSLLTIHLMRSVSVRFVSRHLQKRNTKWRWESTLSIFSFIQKTQEPRIQNSWPLW